MSDSVDTDPFNEWDYWQSSILWTIKRSVPLLVICADCSVLRRLGCAAMLAGLQDVGLTTPGTGEEAWGTSLQKRGEQSLWKGILSLTCPQALFGPLLHPCAHVTVSGHFILVSAQCQLPW